MPESIPVGLMVVAMCTDQPNIQRRLELVLAVAQPVQALDSWPCVLSKPVAEVTVSDRQALITLVGPGGAAGLALGPARDADELPAWQDLGGAGPVAFQGGVILLRGYGCSRCGQGHWTEDERSRRHEMGAAVRCPHCGQPSKVVHA